MQLNTYVNKNKKGMKIMMNNNIVNLLLILKGELNMIKSRSLTNKNTI